MKRLEGYLDNGRGEPLADINATASVLGTGAPVDMTATDDDGHWVFDSLPTAFEYLVTLTDAAGNAVSRAPWSGEMRELWVRDRLDVLGKPVVLDPAAGNSLAWTATGLFVPPGLTQAAADLRYVNLDGDTMVGDLTTTGLTVQYTSNLADAHFAGDVDVTASLWVGEEIRVGTLPGKPVVVSPTAGNTLTWDATGLYSAGGMTQAAADTRYVNTVGDTMSGSLAVVNSTSTRISNVRAAGSLQRPGIDFERWKTTVDTIEEVAVGSTIGTFGFNASGATNLAYGGSIYAYVDAPIVGGTAPIAFSFYHATLGETYRLDSQGRGWFAPPADTSIFPATPGLYISGKWVGVSPTAGNSLTWNANGFYVNVPAVTDLWVNTAGDTMTGLLIEEGAVAATVVHQTRVALDVQPRFTVRADGRLDWGGGAVAVDVPMYRVTAGDFRIGANFSGSTNNTRDLGFTTVQWKAIYGNQLFLSGDGTSGPAWAASGALRLRNGATGNIAWRNAANTADLALGVDATNALVFNGAALGGGLTQAAADLRYLQLTGGSLSGALTITSGDLTLNAGRINILQANAGLEFGAQGTANTPFFDFHSGAVNTDWDVRLIASGGTGVNSGGTLEINATLWKVSANETISGTLVVAGAATFNSNLTMGAGDKISFASEIKDDKIELYAGGYTIGVRAGTQAYFVPAVGDKHAFLVNNVETFSVAGASVKALTTFEQQGGYAYLGGFNSGGGPTYPRAGSELAVAWNLAGREIALWNNDTAAAAYSFIFRQLTGASAYRNLFYINPDGATQQTIHKTSGMAHIIYNNNITTNMFGIEHDGALRFYTLGSAFGGSGVNTWGTAPVQARLRLTIKDHNGGVVGYVPIYT